MNGSGETFDLRGEFPQELVDRFSTMQRAYHEEVRGQVDETMALEAIVAGESFAELEQDLRSQLEGFYRVFNTEHEACLIVRRKQTESDDQDTTIERLDADVTEEQWVKLRCMRWGYDEAAMDGLPPDEGVLVKDALESALGELYYLSSVAEAERVRLFEETFNPTGKLVQLQLGDEEMPGLN